MNRQQTIRAFLGHMETMSKSMLNCKIETLGVNMPTHAQLRILFMVFYHNHQSIKELAERIHATSSAITQSVNSLVRDSLLIRIEDVNDRRKIYLKITPEGKKIITIAKKQQLEITTRLFASLTDAELLHLEKIQKKIIDNLPNKLIV